MSTVVPHYTLKEAASRFLIGNGLGVSALRTEIRRGNLRVTVVAGKFLVTEADVAAMLEACRKCPDPEKPHGSTCAPAPAAPRSGSSETERLSKARSATKMIVEELKKPSAATSARNTSRPTRLQPANSSSTK